MGKVNRIGLHLLFWLVFCSMPILFLPVPPHGHHPLIEHPGHFLYVFVIKNIKFVILFYVHQCFLIPAFFSKGRLVQYMFILLAMMMVVSMIPFLQEYLGIRIHVGALPEHHHEGVGRRMQRGPMPRMGMWMDAGMHFFMTIIVGVLPLMKQLYSNWLLEKKGRSEMELAFLKSQINHHFLFNSLNSIYALSIQQHPKVSEAILNLSGIMRYLLDTDKSEWVALAQEVNYVRQYVSLQDIRSNDKVSISLRVEGDMEGLEIAPMILFPLIENCFKHGISTHSDSPIEISIKIDDTVLILNTSNKIHSDSSTTNVSEIGIKNLNRRLYALYPERFELKIEKHADRYYSHLKIQLI